jgi:hypothetical protein
MLGKYAIAYVSVVAQIDEVIQLLKTISMHPIPQTGKSTTPVDIVTLAMLGKEKSLDKEVADAIKIRFEIIIASISTRMSFPSVVAQSKRLTRMIEQHEGPKAIHDVLVELKSRLLDELGERQFLYVSPERVRFYQEPMLMGKEVNDRFPLAIDDIEDAGKCLALGQGTACVLHTMRIMECGLKAAGKALNIPYAPSWEAYLKQISDNIAKKHKNKTAAWKRDEKFYRDLSGDLLTVKQAWRNPTMHVDRKYAVEEAEQIFIAAKSFMARLAEHFSQKEMEKLLKKS